MAETRFYKDFYPTTLRVFHIVECEFFNVEIVFIRQAYVRDEHNIYSFVIEKTFQFICIPVADF